MSHAGERQRCDSNRRTGQPGKLQILHRRPLLIQPSRPIALNRPLTIKAVATDKHIYQKLTLTPVAKLQQSE
jgi:hypothetical protein